jgi:hypothetical protein
LRAVESLLFSANDSANLKVNSSTVASSLKIRSSFGIDSVKPYVDVFSRCPDYVVSA